MNHATIVALCLLLAPPAVPDSVDFELTRQPPAREFHTSREFEGALDEVLTASWSNVSLRRMLERIGETQRVAVLLDRRIDPTREVDFRIDNQNLQAGLADLAQRVDAGTSVVGDCIYIGPTAAAAKLRTLVRLRSNELQRLSVSIGRRVELSDKQTVVWPDFQKPRELLEELATRYNLAIANPEVIPHDLWGQGIVPSGDAIEALSLILIQFDLTFEWHDDAGGIRIVPCPETVAIRRAYPIRRASPADALAEWKQAIPGLDARRSGDRIIVSGTVEQHESVGELLRRSRSPSDAADESDTPRTVPLKNRRFTLRYRGKADALIRTLEKSNVDLQYNEEVLQAAGIDFTQVIEMDVEDATAEDFFRELCDQLKLKFTIEAATVTLTPAANN